MRPMSLWSRLQSLLEETRRRTLGAVLDALAEHRAKRDELAFSIALIALSAKMAKADGVVTDDEVAAFLDFFEFAEREKDKVHMVYNLAQKDVAGFSHYLAQVQKIFEDDKRVLEDVLDCLFHIAAADGVAHPCEIEMLDQAAEIFDICPQAVQRMRARHLGLGEDDPYLILGVDPDIDEDGLKAAYHALVKAHHPDVLAGRQEPPGLIKMAEDRLAAINAAYEKITMAQGA